ncbi:MAG: flagellar export chaperone FliS [Syntrophales bacterium]|nr:flagellar export chaperone FliS [Syntrophales bacterium]
MQKNNSNAYQQTNVLTADPGKLIILCYEKVIHHLTLSVKHYENREYEAKAKNLQKAVDIISELNGCLDMKRGGEIARNLDGLYKFMVVHLLKSDLNRDIDGFRHVINLLKELGEAWKEIVTKPKPELIGKVMQVSFTTPKPAMAAVASGRMWSA